MKNKFFFLILFLSFQPLLAENLNIQSTNISIDKKSKLTIFKDNVKATDNKNNSFSTEYAEYSKELQLLTSKGKTKILTSKKYDIEGENIIFDNKNNVIKSNFPAILKDLENNLIYLEKFEYSTEKNFFRSTGNIKVVDSKDNSYNFSQIYIDENKKEIVGTDIKAFLNQDDFKANKNNKPRVFSNTVKLDNNFTQFTKSNFTLCNYREKDKCPPWSLQAGNMTHDKKKKTIYYDNAVIKIYDFPVFYTPRFSHPDPTVDRRSGLLPPSFSDSKNLGPGLGVPYFWNIDRDKDFTLTTKLFSSENPLFTGEYRQSFKQSNLILDFGYTDGYKKTSSIKKSGQKSHFFSKFVKNFKGKNDSENNFQLSVQDVSNDKYMKLYKIKSALVDYNTDTLENSIDFSHENDDLFLGIKASSYETLKEGYNDKYEYILPDITLDKNLFRNDIFGTLDLQSNLKIHNYDTNKFTKFLVNDFNWKYKNINFNNGFSGEVLGKLKNVNYETKNVTNYKDEPTNELFGAMGFLTKLDLYKDLKNNSKHYLTPKALFRYSPGSMRDEKTNTRLKYSNIFDIDRLNTYNNFETGKSLTLGFDYSFKNQINEFILSAGQVINQNENNKMPSSSSMDEKLSDLVGHSELKINDKLNLKYDFALDQNYNELNYNEVGTSLNFEPVNLDFSWLQEKKHIGNQEYVKSSLTFVKGNNALFTAETKRNLITNSAEYYNLSYEYINDCLKAGIVYRREFYEDSELEAENSLMFKITLVPLANINSPLFNQ
tara:strand:+ start:503 stop:2812 length:2310 start_codon:yes stop_codon:yes gene_type:complete